MKSIFTGGNMKINKVMLICLALAFLCYSYGYSDDYKIYWGDGTVVKFNSENLKKKVFLDSLGKAKTIFYVPEWEKKGKLASWLDDKGVPFHIYKKGGSFNVKVTFVGNSGNESVLSKQTITQPLITEKSKPIVSVVNANYAIGDNYYENANTSRFSYRIKFPGKGEYIIINCTWYAQFSGDKVIKTYNGDIATFNFPIPTYPEPPEENFKNKVWVKVEYSFSPDGKYSMFNSVTSEKMTVFVKDQEMPFKVIVKDYPEQAFCGEEYVLPRVTVKDNNPWLSKDFVQIMMRISGEDETFAVTVPGPKPTKIYSRLKKPYKENNIFSFSEFSDVKFMMPINYVGDCTAGFNFYGYTFDTGDIETADESVDLNLQVIDSKRPNIWVYFDNSKTIKYWLPGEDAGSAPAFNMKYKNNNETLPTAVKEYEVSIFQNTRLRMKVRVEDNVDYVNSNKVLDGHLHSVKYSYDGLPAENLELKNVGNYFEENLPTRMFSRTGHHILEVTAEDSAGSDPYGLINNKRTVRYRIIVKPFDFSHKTIQQNKYK